MREPLLVLASLLLSACADDPAALPALGTLERDRIELRADSDQPLLEVLVREGDRVDAGAVLSRQDPRLADALMASARARAAAAEAALAEAEHGPRGEAIRQARARLAAARSARTVADSDLRRARDLARRELLAEDRLAQLEGALEQADARVDETAAVLEELETGTRSEVLARLRAEAAAAAAAVTSAALAVERTRLIAPVAGVVEALPFEAGERPTAGATVVALLDQRRLYARVHLPAPLRSRLQTGAPAQVVVEGLDGSIEGRLAWVASEAAFTPFYALTQQDASRLAWLAEVDLPPDSVLPVGVPVQVTFPGPAMSTAIRTRGLTRRFGRLVAVDHVDLDIARGSIHGFLGPNGCGKSTTIRLLCGLLQPSAGEVQVLGIDVRADPEALRSRIGYMTQRFSFYEDLTVRENLQFMARIHGLPRAERRPRIDSALQRYALDDRPAQLAGTLSGGQRQRLALAGVTMHEPELLLLDEPTSAVDPESRRRFWEELFRLSDQGTTVLVSSHFMDEAERCHALSILDEGRLVAGGEPRQLMADLPATVLELTTDAPQRTRQALLAVDGVLEVTQLGARLHVLLDPGLDQPESRVQRALADSATQAGVERIRATLEDVFVMATRDAEAA